MEVTVSQSLATKIIEDLMNGEQISKVSIERATKKGDGFLSFITKVDFNTTTKSFNLIIKSAPSDENLRKYSSIRVCFLQEIYFYDVIVPSLRKFQNSCFPVIPQCLKCCKEPGSEFLVLENMKEKGFVMLDRRLEMDEAHISIVLREYAKFHATSFAFREQRLEEYRNLVGGVGSVFNAGNFPDLFRMFRVSTEKMKELFAPEDDRKLYDALARFPRTVTPFFRMVEETSRETGIILHGDCWSNNILFKYENSASPTAVCFLDFQLIRISSPMVDLSYFLCMSAPKRVLSQLDSYLDLYYETLSHELRALGTDPEVVYPLETLKREWRTYSKYGFILGLTLFRSVLREDDEIRDYTDVVGDDLTMEEMFMRESKSEALMNTRLRNLIMFMYENELL